jgi:hypothetical protein
VIFLTFVLFPVFRLAGGASGFVLNGVCVSHGVGPT